MANSLERLVAGGSCLLLFQPSVSSGFLVLVRCFGQFTLFSRWLARFCVWGNACDAVMQPLRKMVVSRSEYSLCFCGLPVSQWVKWWRRPWWCWRVVAKWRVLVVVCWALVVVVQPRCAA